MDYTSSSSESSSIRIVLADDHALLREGVRRLLEMGPGFIVVGEAEDGAQAVAQCLALRPDIVLLDVCMPRVTGMEALSRLREECPGTAAVLLTAGIDRRGILEAVMLGARGVVLKSVDPDVLLKCVREVASGGYWLEHGAINDLVGNLRAGLPDVGSTSPSEMVHLTRRERQIVSAVIAGATNADIGRAFGLCHQTVKNHLTRIFGKLGVTTRLELAVYAIDHDLAVAAEEEDLPLAVN
jgi:two-component system, NarL family, nitrate/nitrite response regulator NarL